MIGMPYGLREGKLVSANEVPRGLDCGCFCPTCGSKLMTKKGPYRTAHFAHYNNHDCKGWLETAIHQRAKELLAQNKKLMLPPVYRVPREGECKTPWSLITFEEVDLEVTIGNGRADAVGIKNGRSLAVEIALTHKVEEKRIIEYRELMHAAVEIDISPVDKFNDDIINSLLSGANFDRRWIYNQHIESHNHWRKEKNDNGLNSLRLRRDYYAY